MRPCQNVQTKSCHTPGRDVRRVHLSVLKSSFNALLKSSIIPFISAKMDVAVTFAKDEDAARQHIQKLRDDWKFQDDGHVDTNHKSCRMAQTYLDQYRYNVVQFVESLSANQL